MISNGPVVVATCIVVRHYRVRGILAKTSTDYTVRVGNGVQIVVFTLLCMI